jgi:N6-adenosine-specific RNA methylase IME4
MLSMSRKMVPLETIRIGVRHRQDLGDVQALAASIERVGLLHPIVVSVDGLLIAGQRRLAACVLLRWAEVPVTVGDLTEAALGEQHENIARKDLLPTEIVGLKRAIESLERAAARARQGCRTDLGHPATVAGCDAGDVRDIVARYAGIGRTTLTRAEEVVQAAEEDPDEYGYLVEQMDRTGKVAGAYRRLQVHRQARELEQELEQEQPASPTGPFRVIVADPPWRYDRANRLAYPTMALDEIRRVKVRDIAAVDSVLWLWTTNAHLRVAFDVAECWGFEYKTVLTWVKDRMSTGDWLRGQSEHCLLCARGRPVLRLTSQTTVLAAVLREHSRKPDEFYTRGSAVPGQQTGAVCAAVAPGLGSIWK